MWPVLGMEGGHGDGEEGWKGRTWRWNVCRGERQSRVLGTPASWLRPLDRRWCPSLKWKMKGEEEVWRWHTKQALLFSELNRNVSGSRIRLRCVSSPVPAPPHPRHQSSPHRAGGIFLKHRPSHVTLHQNPSMSLQCSYNEI